ATIVLEPPPDVNRLITITVESMVTNVTVISKNSERFSDTRFVQLNPTNPKATVVVANTNTVTGKLVFDLEMETKPESGEYTRNIVASVQAQEYDGDEETGRVNAFVGSVIAKDETLSWTGVRVVNKAELLGWDWSTFDFTITNGQAGA